MSLPPPRWKWECAWTAWTDVEAQKGARRDLEDDLEAGVFLRNLLIDVHCPPLSHSQVYRQARALRP